MQELKINATEAAKSESPKSRSFIEKMLTDFVERATLSNAIKAWLIPVTSPAIAIPAPLTRAIA